MTEQKERMDRDVGLFILYTGTHLAMPTIAAVNNPNTQHMVYLEIELGGPFSDTVVIYKANCTDWGRLNVSA